MPRLNPGDPITADYLNRHDQAADVVLGRGTRPGAPLRLEYDTNRITVKNSSGADRRRGEILEFTGCPLTSLAGGDLWLTGGSPTLANGFGVLLNPIPNNKFGNKDCQIDGPCVALVNVTSSSHKFADVASGNCVLQSGIAGSVRILHAPGTGEQSCAVLLNYAVTTEQLVQLNHATATAGDLVAANASGLHSARIKRWTGTAFENGPAVWLLLCDYYDVDSGAVIAEQGKYYGPAKLAGNRTVSSDERPLYIAHVGEQTFLAKHVSGLSKGSSGTFALYHRSSETDSGLTKSAKALGAAIGAAKWATIERVAGQWYAGCWES